MPSRNSLRALTRQHSSHSLEHLPLHSYLYHMRPYSSLSTIANTNGFYLRRLLKSNYRCQFEESDPTIAPKLHTNKSTFILGRYMLTVHMNRLQLFSISDHRLLLIGEDHCQVKIVFIGICTYSDLHGKCPVKQDGFILMTADQRFLLYDFKLKSRLSSSKGISFQCELPLRFTEKAFEYHEQNQMISIHARYKQNSHAFVLLRLWPRWLSYVMLIQPEIFGTDMKQAAITHEFLIVQTKRNSCHLYSLHHLLDQFTIKSHSIADHLHDPLPVNVQITSCPPCLYTFTSDRPFFDYAMISREHFLSRIHEDYFVFHLSEEPTAVSNGHLKRSWEDNVSANGLVYFLDSHTPHDYILDIRESSVHVWLLNHQDRISDVKHVYTIDDGSGPCQTSTDRHVTRYGRECRTQQTLNLSASSLTDHYFDLSHNFLTLLFESDSSDLAIIRLIEHPSGLCRQTIQFRKFHKQNQLKINHEHDLLIVQELSCTTVILRVFTLKRSRSTVENQ